MSVPSYLKFAPRILRKSGVLPHYLVFFVTKNCTANCRHCLLGSEAHSTDELTVDEIERITEHMDPLLFLLITGGDPFIRKDISEIVKTFYRRPGFRNLGMPSNGFLTDRIVGETERILMDCPGIDFAVDISIDGIGDDHDYIRQKPGLFDRAVTTYRQLEKLTKKYANFNLNVAVTVSSYNHDKLDALYRFLKMELGVVNINHLLCRGNPTDPAALQVNMDHYQAFSRQLDRDLRDDALKGYHGYPFADLVNAMKIVRQKLIAHIRNRDEYVAPCYAARLGAILYPDGDVAPCELRDEILGNLRLNGYNFRAVIESETAGRIRRKIADEHCHCTYECFLTNAVMFNPALFGKVLAEAVRIKFHRWFPGGS
ncbi:MAG TPA: radical SAM/SPASM domain-containing protein [bacterium]|nr:radical SAM/SPASM domain-containing protein [bacterium]